MGVKRDRLRWFGTFLCVEAPNGVGIPSMFRRLTGEFNLRRRFNTWWPKYKQQLQIKRTYPLKSYSQFGEDIVLQHLLPEQIGTYIDLGSGQPIVGSNTYLLYQRGWSGVLVDPIESNITDSKKVRPRDVCIQAACGQDSNQSVTFYEYNIYEYSTTSLERVNELKELGHLVSNTYTVKSVNINDLFELTESKSPLVICIDVEGGELNVLRQINWEKFVPDFIVVEEWDPPTGKQTPILRYLSEHGYEIQGVVGMSSIYAVSK